MYIRSCFFRDGMGTGYIRFQRRNHTHLLWMYPTTWSSTENSTNCPFLSCKIRHTQKKTRVQMWRRSRTYQITNTLARTWERTWNSPFRGCRSWSSGSTRRGRTHRHARCPRRRGGRRPSQTPLRKWAERRRRKSGGGACWGAGGG